jgi:hypothetical protein
MRTFRGLLLLCAAVACIESGRMQALVTRILAKFGRSPRRILLARTICWSRKGARANFAANGQYTDNQHVPVITT